jgi:hypothetical protein
MLEWPKWYHCETKSLAEIHITHVGLNQRNLLANFRRLLIETKLALGEHAGRAVHPGDLLAKPCDRNEHPSGTASQLEDLSVICARFLDVEVHVGAISIEGYAIVELADSFDFVAVMSHPAT